MGLSLLVSNGYGDTIDWTQDQLTPGTYNPATILKTANRLIAAGGTTAYKSLLAYSLTDRSSCDEYVTWLCVLLYDPKPGATLKTPLFGSPGFPFFRDHHQDNVDWPKFPLLFDKGVPFYFGGGYTLIGDCLSSSDYVELYHEKGIFRTQPYVIPTRSAAKSALNELLDSPQWKTLDWSTTPEPGDKAVVIEAMRNQIQRIPEN